MGLIETSKQVLRKQIAEKIAKIPKDEKKRQSDIILQKLLNLPSFKGSKRISVFLSTADEVNTEPIVRQIFEDGKECFVPRYCKKTMEMVKLHDMKDWETLPLTKWNIKQPKLSDERTDALKTGGLDLIIVPGVGFSPDGRRLGHGGGYYDKFLKNIKEVQITPPITIALGFQEQIYPEIPVCDHDIAIDVVLSSD